MKNKVINLIKNNSSIELSNGEIAYFINERIISEIAEDVVKLFAMPCVTNGQIIVVECIKKPSSDKYIETAVTVGERYKAVEKNDKDYKLIDDNGKEFYYQLEHFIEVAQ